MSVTAPAPNRRDIFHGVGALVVSSFAMSDVAVAAFAEAVSAGKPPLLPTELDSLLSIDVEGRVTALFGKMDMGQGVETAVMQIIAEDLDVVVDSVRVVMCDTASTLDMGGATNSSGVWQAARVMRNAAAEARRVLLEMAARHLDASIDDLDVAGGVVRIVKTPSKRVSYRQLIGGRYFHTKVEWNQHYNFLLNITGKAKPKQPDQHTVVGRPYPAVEVPAKVFGRTEYASDVRLPGMLHARMMRPAIAGAVPLTVDEASIGDIAGAKVVHIGDLLAVVAPDEWDAVRAARQLAVTWSDAKPPLPEMTDLAAYLRTAPTVMENAEDIYVGKKSVDQSAAESGFARAVRIIEREYEWPFQSHACMGPACAVVDIRDGHVTAWTGTQKAHSARAGIAAILGIPPENVRVIWKPGPGSYGRNDAGDAVMDAAVIANALNRPVRVQYMRDEGHGWDPKGPACIIQMKAGLDAESNLTALRFKARAFSSRDTEVHEGDPSATLAGMLTGAPLGPVQNFGIPANNYELPGYIAFWQTVPALLDRASPLRTSHLRDPQGPQCQFASEAFMDIIAYAAKVDPVAFRLRYLTGSRDIAVIEAAAERAGWEPHRAPRRRTRNGKMIGQGIAYAIRGGTIAAMVAEIEVDPDTGRIWARKFTVAHDSGQIINPALLKKTIEGNVVMATSRALFEAVTFDRSNVTSTDWASYPILEIEDAPEAIDILLLDHPDIDPTGAGEATTRHVAAAIANAIHDATGRSPVRAPFRPETIKALIDS